VITKYSNINIYKTILQKYKERERFLIWINTLVIFLVVKTEILFEKLRK